MRKFVFLFVFTFVSQLIYAQPDRYATALMNIPFIVFEEQQINFRETVHPSIGILVTADMKDYSKDWKNWLKAQIGQDSRSTSGYYSAMNVIMSSVSPDSINIHYGLSKDGDAVRLNILVDKGGVFFSEKDHPELISKLKASVSGQVKSFYIKYYDEKIADQQKHYDKSLKEMSKLKKKQDKYASSLVKRNKNIDKAEDEMRSANSKVKDSEAKIKLLNAQLAVDDKGVEQALKEAYDHQQLISAREGDYNRLNSTGTLNSKEGSRVLKDLDKMRSKQEKLQANILKSKSVVTKTQQNILKEEGKKTQLLSMLESGKSKKEKNGSEISGLKNAQEKNENNMKDEQVILDAALADLDKLKSAKTTFVEKR